jgi:hypothetical protein
LAELRYLGIFFVKNRQDEFIKARGRLVSARHSRHNGRMSEQPTADDLEKAHLILSEFGLLIGPAGEMSDVIARAVAAGIALGRKEGLAEKRRRKA